jgi:high-affinity Fe2+/Pb2+ permease
MRMMLVRTASSGGTTPEQVQVIVLLLVVTLIVALVSRRLRLPYTLVLVDHRFLAHPCSGPSGSQCGALSLSPSPPL